MTMGCKTRGILCVALIGIVFSLSKGALSYAEAQPANPIRDLKVSDLFVPEELGYVIERHPPTGSPTAPVVVHIQEAHTNYEGQKHLAAILERLIEGTRRNAEAFAVGLASLFGSKNVGVAHHGVQEQPFVAEGDGHWPPNNASISESVLSWCSSRNAAQLLLKFRELSFQP